ncbi:MAG: hypothetical protein U0804_28595 [Gemmataceae bacterium]
MSNAKHTPGPWHIELGRSSNPIVGTDAVSIAEVLDDVFPDTEQQAANAKLIAAAPDLLLELRTVEWGGTIENQSSRDPAGAGCCPCCRGIDPAYPWPSRFPRATFGHTKDCTLAAALKKATTS